MVLKQAGVGEPESDLESGILNQVLPRSLWCVSHAHQPRSRSLSDYGGAKDEIVGYPKTQSWKEGTSYCNWDRIKCENGIGNVIGLDI
ncbi:hypothetical protein FEM48_Zijuj01G0246400 [Ziziphus jujuba var. spinosa]|uniref:Leucine-rich repeat-containing N-terminal plant-type domain-containing protein n=1 Tax=Ziziphus jujuba var. spinosa TaxID=714518 RepID=A0A978W4I2_ZIZJJ|nr:hypothetical protein FEM48_Zijuj01G0246400 [Ziziphus jujuba var. spinosa]